MNLPDVLSYADIAQLQTIATHAHIDVTSNSKHDLMQRLLRDMQHPRWWREQTEALAAAEKRFWQLLLLDSRDTFNVEELVGKGRQALAGKEGNPRALVAQAMRAGLLFPCVSRSDRSLYRVPRDVQTYVVRALRDGLLSRAIHTEQPAAYRDEQLLFVHDLVTFLTYVGQNDVRLTAGSAIYRRDLQALLAQMHVSEQPIVKTRWRFGFGRRYHQYPDRFSLLYDYAYYRGYIAELEQMLALTVSLREGQLAVETEAERVYNFWLRLYRKAIPTLPLIVKWLYVLASEEWVVLAKVRAHFREWLTPFYYMSADDLLALVVKMLVHLGVIRLGCTQQLTVPDGSLPTTESLTPTASDDAFVRMTDYGSAWVARSAGWDLRELDSRFTTV